MTKSEEVIKGPKYGRSHNMTEKCPVALVLLSAFVFSYYLIPEMYPHINGALQLLQVRPCQLFGKLFFNLHFYLCTLLFCFSFPWL